MYYIKLSYRRKIIIAGGPFPWGKADGSPVDGRTGAADRGGGTWLMLEEKVIVVDCPAETPV